MSPSVRLATTPFISSAFSCFPPANFRRSCRFWRRREVGAAAAGDEFSLLVEYLRLGGCELRSAANDFAARDEIAAQRWPMIIDPQVDGRHAAAGLFDHRPVGSEIDQRRQHAAAKTSALGIDDPLLAPLCPDLD